MKKSCADEIFAASTFCQLDTLSTCKNILNREKGVNLLGKPKNELGSATIKNHVEKLYLFLV
jgi:hypothetical protein